MAAEPTDAELWRSVEHTVRNVLLPALDDDWARAVAVQLVGLARWAAVRPTADRGEAAELAEVLRTLAGNPIIDALGPVDPTDERAVLAAAGAALAAAVGRDDEAASEIRSRLRPVVVRQLDDRLAIDAPLVPVFRGHLDA